MPSGSGDTPAQAPAAPLGNGFGSGLHLEPSIWSSPFSHARDRPIASRDFDEAPSGSSALNANSEAVPWHSSSSPWNVNPSVGPAPNNAASASASASAKAKAADIQPRSVNTSPNRTREGGVSNGSAFYENGSAAVGTRAAGFTNGAFQDDTNGFAAPLRQQKRNNLQDQSLIDSMSSFNLVRDHSVPPSRQSQGSPSGGDHLYRGHTPSNSISQRPMHQHSASLSNSHARDLNQRAFAMNGHIAEDLQLGYGRRAPRDNGTRGFNPSTQPFHPNSGSAVSWSTGGEGNASRINGGPDFNTDALSGQQHANARRQVGDLASPAPNYRVELSNGQRSYAPSPEPWMDGPLSRDSRAADDRRTPSVYGANFQHQPQQPWYGAQFQFPLPPQYPASYMDAPYAIRPVNGLYAPNQNVPGGFPLPGPMAGIRPARDQDITRRSPLLEEFRSSTKHNKKYELKDIYGYIVEFSGDQHGSRFIQGKLGTANSDEKERVFDELQPNAIQLAKDVFGNYVVQKLFEHGSQVQKKMLAQMMRGRVVELSMQSYACRVVQKALEHILVDQQAELAQELQPEIIKVIKCSNGNHVVQKIIELVPRKHFGFIMDAMRGSIAILSNHQYGCRVIQRMLEHGTETDKAEIMAELHSSLPALIQDQYGNYVAQHVLTNGKDEDRARIVQLVLVQLEALSKHKFASNVVEKCIIHGSPEQRRAIRAQLTAAGSDGTSPLPVMMRDQYANYVIQKLCAYLPEDERDSFKEDVKPHLEGLRKANASRQLQALEKFLASSETEVSGSVRSNGANNDANSAAPTPVLTNETNSPQSSSPSSSHVSAVDAPGSGDTKKGATETVDAVDPQVEGEAQ